jgi:serine/threonine protein kinase
MTIAAGSRLGHYTIVSRLGAGGMGEVWLAEDATLKRKVAVKVSTGSARSPIQHDQPGPGASSV